jgi:hypothetical protein
MSREYIKIEGALPILACEKRRRRREKARSYGVNRTSKNTKGTSRCPRNPGIWRNSSNLPYYGQM